MALGFATAVRNGLMDYLSDQLDGGFIDIYDGTRAANANTAIGSQVKLAHIPLSNPASAASSSGVITLTTPAEDTSAGASGTATWFRATSSGGTGLFDGSVTASGGGGDCELVSTTITALQPVRITSATITAPAA